MTLPQVVAQFFVSVRTVKGCSPPAGGFDYATSKWPCHGNRGRYQKSHACVGHTVQAWTFRSIKSFTDALRWVPLQLCLVLV